MNFKDFYTEAAKPRKLKKPKLDGFIVPSPRAKFQAGDIVAVNVPRNLDDQQELNRYFRSYSPQYAVPYMNGVGTVRSFKKGLMSSKYAVEFEDGNVIPIHSGFLIGPFSSIENAKKYQGKHSYSPLRIDTGDLAGFAPDSKVEVNDKIENKFKQSFVNEQVGFKWLADPVVVKFKDFDVYVLAVKKNVEKVPASKMESSRLNFVNFHQDADRVDNPTRPELNNHFVFCKTVDRVTKKLIKTQRISHRGSGSYFLQRPNLDRYITDKLFVDGKAQNPFDLFGIGMYPFGGGSIQEIKTEFHTYDNSKEIIKTGFDYFKARYRVQEGSTFVKELHDYILVDQKILKKDFDKIKDFTLHGSVYITYEDDVNTLFCLPKEVKGSLKIAFKKLHSLEGIEQCDLIEDTQLFFEGEVDSFKGFSKQMNVPERRVDFRVVQSLEGIPDELFCNLSIGSLKSFKGASNCVNKGHVRINGAPENLNGFFKEKGEFASWNLTDEKIKAFLDIRGLENEFPEIAGTFSF